MSFYCVWDNNLRAKKSLSHIYSSQQKNSKTLKASQWTGCVAPSVGNLSAPKEVTYNLTTCRWHTNVQDPLKWLVAHLKLKAGLLWSRYRVLKIAATCSIGIIDCYLLAAAPPGSGLLSGSLWMKSNLSEHLVYVAFISVVMRDGLNSLGPALLATLSQQNRREMLIEPPSNNKIRCVTIGESLGQTTQPKGLLQWTRSLWLICIFPEGKRWYHNTAD